MAAEEEEAARKAAEEEAARKAAEEEAARKAAEEEAARKAAEEEAARVAAEEEEAARKAAEEEAARKAAEEEAARKAAEEEAARKAAEEEAARVAAEEEAARKAAEEEAARVAAEEEAAVEEQEAARTKDEEERPIAEVGLDDDESEAVSGRDRAVSSSEETQRVEAGRKAAKNIQVVRMPGLDSLRRPIVVVNARAWPTEKEASDLAMADVKAALAPVVQNDYALVFDLKSGAEQSTGARMAMRLLSYYRFVHPQAKHARE